MYQKNKKNFIQKAFTFGICNYIHIRTYIYNIYIIYIICDVLVLMYIY